ncbi:hypothetical protein M5C72_07175 [Companilactobacillus allii]|uniref:Uncharacterized protein n=1 Tax=Companilactobacillus allii TaxID=1847728 RepID=A0A1P8Q4Y9_9LACO|nr:hypothetical protein [Companilactobacillus allii]APX72879.1 hypothetical protein BTM29_10090 [Companilactobacillus allii]USQ67667.1 hypothetical protein M5C72_07175 [Companilactobacillus allii]
MSLTDERIKRVITAYQDLSIILYKLVFKKDLSKINGIYTVTLKKRKLEMTSKEFKSIDVDMQKRLRESDLVTIPINKLDYFELKELLEENWRKL